MLKKEYTVTVQSMNGETIEVFGNDVPPTDEDIERCLDACAEQGGMFAFVDTVYAKE